MDAESRSVVAAADGKVVFVNDGCDDRCSTGTCGGGSGSGNSVKLQHTDGESTTLAALLDYIQAVGGYHTVWEEAI